MRTLLALAAGLGLLAWAPPAAGQKADKKADKKPALVFELYKDAGGEFRWRLKGANGEPVATSGQGYKAKADARNGVDRLVKDAGGDKVKFEVYEDKRKEHRFRVKAANGQTIGASAEGYKAKADADRAVDLIKKGAADAKVVDMTDKGG